MEQSASLVKIGNGRERPFLLVMNREIDPNNIGMKPKNRPNPPTQTNVSFRSKNAALIAIPVPEEKNKSVPKSIQGLRYSVGRFKNSTPQRNSPPIPTMNVFTVKFIGLIGWLATK